MRSWLLFALLPLCSGYLKTSWRDLQANPGYSFADYIKEYEKAYPDAAEYARREQLFNAAVKIIREHNARDASWKMGLNQFTDWDEKEIKRMRGRASEKSRKLAKTPEVPQGFVAPQQVDWRNVFPPVLTGVKNQGGCGSCWAFSTTESIESALAMATGELVTLGPQQLVSCAPNPMDCGGTGGCGGSTQPIGFNYTMHAGGLSTEDSYPYKSGGDGVTRQCNQSLIKPKVDVGGWIELPVNDATALINAVATVGPVAISADASNWHQYESGVLDTCGWDVNHCIQLVGYGQDGSQAYWIVRNSWGPSYGENGYIRLLRQDDEPCGLDKKPQDGLACKNQTEPIKYCGMCGVLSGSSYPTGARLVY